MRAILAAAGLAVMTLGVAWLLSKMTRTDQADWLAIKLVVALVVSAAVLAAALAIGNVGGRRR